jgi:hypothetical protein
MPPYHGRRRRWPWIVILVIAALFLWLWEPWRDPPPPGGPNPETLEGIVEIAQAGPEVPGSLAAYWKTKLSSADPPIAVRRPRGFIPYQVDAFPETACFWDSSDRNNASYCSDDHKISWDADWFQELHRLFGSVAPLSVLAHEYGHHISYLLNDLKGAGPRYSKQDELQADCFAGMYLSSANKTLNLSNRQLVLEAFEIFKSADPQSDDPWFAAGRHGSGQERLKAMGNGFFLRSLQGSTPPSVVSCLAISPFGVCQVTLQDPTSGQSTQPLGSSLLHRRQRGAERAGGSGWRAGWWWLGAFQKESQHGRADVFWSHVGRFAGAQAGLDQRIQRLDLAFQG